MSSILDIVYASAPVDEIIHHTIELQSSHGGRRLVQGYNDLTVTLENGTQTTFQRAYFAVSLPQKALKGAQELQFQIDNVSGDALSFIEAAMAAGSKITVIYRAFLSSNLSAPAETPLRLTVTASSIDTKSASLRATFHDLVNTPWPKRRYTADFAPGLIYG